MPSPNWPCASLRFGAAMERKLGTVARPPLTRGHSLWRKGGMRTGAQGMGSVQFPRLVGRRRAGPRMGRLRRIGVAAAVLAAMAVAGGVHSAASAATGAPYGGGGAPYGGGWSLPPGGGSDGLSGVVTR